MIVATSDSTLQHGIPKANRLEICDLPEDVLILIFSWLCGQDVARCIPVCRCFSDLIRRNLSLQYSLELAMSGMVDGDHSTLPVSEKLQRLREYFLYFQRGAFCQQDLTAYPDYLRRNRDLLGYPRRVIRPTKPLGAIYTKTGQDASVLYLSHFVPGSAHAGIPSSCVLFSVQDGVKRELDLRGWAVDDAQDLFVTVEMTRTRILTNVTPGVYVRFYSLSSLKADTGPPTSHPAATLPVINLHTFHPAAPINVSQPQIVGPYLILQVLVDGGARQPSYSVDVYHWKTGDMISRTDVGNLLVTVIPLDEPYLLIFPCTRMPERHPDLRIFSFAPSPPQSSQSVSQAGRHVCTLELPPAPPGERVAWSLAKSGGRSSDENTGHFCADAARSVVSLYIHYEGVERRGKTEHDYEIDEEDEDEDEEEDQVVYAYATHLLVPRTTLAAQIQAAESASTSRPFPDQPELRPAVPLVVPWAEWGPRGTLRLYQRGALFDSEHIVISTPFGSRFPFVVQAGSDSFSDSPRKSTGSVYVFDVNPLVARSALRTPRHHGAITAVVDTEDVEDALPGVVDPECEAIPFVVYRFALPYPDPPGTDVGAPGSPLPPPEICAVTMSMAGFTVQFDDSVEFEKRFQTCTV